MTSLSTKSSDAIKLFPGKSSSILLDSGDKHEQIHSSESVTRNDYFKNFGLLFTAIARFPEAILIYLSSLCVLFALLSFRVLDDNRLTSWQWVFSQSDLLTISLSLIIALMLAWYLSAIEFSRQYTVATLFVLSYFLGTLHWDNPEVIVDAARYFTQAKYVELYGLSYFFTEWGHGIMAWTDLPLVPFIYGLLFKVVGEHRTGIQVINTFFFSGSVIITYYIGKALWNERVGFYGALMLLAIPYLHTQVPLMLVDVPAMFFLSLAVFAYIQALTRKGVMLAVIAAVCITLAMLAKYSNWLMLSILPVIALVLINTTINHDSRQVMLRQGIHVLVCLSILIGLLLFWRYEIFSKQIGLLIEFQLPALAGWSESHLSTFFFQVHPFVSIAAIASIYFAYRKGDLRYLIIGWMLILILVLDIRRIRYVLIVFPMLALMAGYALAHIEKARIRRYLTLCILFSASIFSVTGFSSFLGSTSAGNIQHAGEYIDSLNVGRGVSVVEVITLPQTRFAVNPIMSIPLFDYFSQKQVIYNVDVVRGIHPRLSPYKRSPLRFTWEYDLPKYYSHENYKTERVIAVISDSKEQLYPADVRERLSKYYLDRRFDNNEGIFRYSTIVDVYVPVQAENKSMTL